MIASRGPAPFLLVRIIIAQVCVSVNLYFIELNSNMVKNQGSYNNANGASILELIHPSDESGFYTFYNISGIPESSNPASEYVRIIKMKEVMIVVCSVVRTYITTASSNSWNGFWCKFTVSEV